MAPTEGAEAAGPGAKARGSPASGPCNAPSPLTSPKPLTFMVGGAVRGGDSGRSGRVTSELLASSCFL